MFFNGRKSVYYVSNQFLFAPSDIISTSFLILHGVCLHNPHISDYSAMHDEPQLFQELERGICSTTSCIWLKKISFHKKFGKRRIATQSTESIIDYEASYTFKSHMNGEFGYSKGPSKE